MLKRRGLAAAALGGAILVTGLVTAAELPVAVAPSPVTTDEDVAVQVVLSGTDADGESLTFAIADPPDNGTLGGIGAPDCSPGPPSSCDAIVTYTPTLNVNGPDSFTFTVDDGTDGTSTAASVSITVDPVNDPPVAADDDVTILENSGMAVMDVVGNDTDVEGQAIEVADASEPDHGHTIVQNGVLRYAPDTGFDGIDTFAYTVEDELGAQDTATVTVTVEPVNSPPTAVDDTATVDEDVVDAEIDVRANDTDTDGPPGTIVAVTEPVHGTATTDGNSIFYSPDADYHGPDAFGYTLEDSGGESDTASVAVTVTSVNDAPTVEIPFEPVVEEDAGAQSFGGFLDGAAGPSDEVLTQGVDFAIDSVTTASLFSVQPEVNPNGTLTFTPAANANGTSTVTVHSFDTGGTANGGVDVSPTQSFTITITPVNDAPTAADDGAPTPLQVAQNAGPTPLGVLANDTTLPDSGETLSIVAVTQGANGVVAISGGGSGLTYDPTGSFTGPDTFTYTITDGLLEATATVHVDVAPDITPPVTAVRVVGSAAAASSSVRVTVRWSAVELQSGVTLYQLQQQTDGGAWATIPLPTPTTTSVERVLAGGHDYAFRVRARDGIGNLGAYSTSGTLRL